MKRAAAALALCLAGATAAEAETLVTALSSDRVRITSNFTGAEIAVFGEIGRNGASVPRAGGYDLVVTVRGPKGSVVVREKQPFGFFWLNLDQRKYIAVPAFISVLSNRPLDQIATPALRARWHLGIENLVPARGDPNDPSYAREPDFRAALVRLRRAQNLFNDYPKSVSFIGDTLFRANIVLPGAVPLGNYEVDVALLVEGSQLATASSTFVVTKSGAEQVIAATARNRAFVYGLATCAIALLAGWLASVMFRRD